VGAGVGGVCLKRRPVQLISVGKRTSVGKQTQTRHKDNGRALKIEVERNTATAVRAGTRRTASAPSCSCTHDTNPRAQQSSETVGRNMATVGTARRARHVHAGPRRVRRQQPLGSTQAQAARRRRGCAGGLAGVRACTTEARREHVVTGTRMHDRGKRCSGQPSSKHAGCPGASNTRGRCAARPPGRAACRGPLRRARQTPGARQASRPGRS
jgi:hypothetical protein